MSTELDKLLTPEQLAEARAHDAKHTPGPWVFYTEPQPNGCPIVGSGGLMVAMLAHSVNYDDQKSIAIANARLIAAAPDLLMALKAVADDMDDDNMERWLQDEIRAAISKATGSN